MAYSPDNIPYLKLSYPNFPIIPLGFYGAFASSSKGLNMAKFLF